MSDDEKQLQHVFRLFDDGASRVRIDANRIPFTVGCVGVDPDDRKPVVTFRLDRGTLNRKELSFNVIRQGH
jgi:hypothetical protein